MLEPPGAGQETQAALSDTTWSRTLIRTSGMWSVSILGPMSILLNSDSWDHLTVYRAAGEQEHLAGKTAREPHLPRRPRAAAGRWR